MNYSTRLRSISKPEEAKTANITCVRRFLEGDGPGTRVDATESDVGYCGGRMLKIGLPCERSRVLHKRKSSTETFESVSWLSAYERMSGLCLAPV